MNPGASSVAHTVMVYMNGSSWLHKPEGGSAALSTGSSWRPCYGHWLEDVHAPNSCHTCTCTHTHLQDLYTQRAIVNSWQGFYRCITPDTQTGEQIMSHGNLDCQTLIYTRQKVINSTFVSNYKLCFTI